MKSLPWRLRRSIPPGEPWQRLREEWGLSPEAARLFWLRGVETPEEAAWRLDPSWERLLDPYLMSGMAPAVARIRLAIERSEPICVYGDYDVDGVTATALLVRVLERLGAQVSFFIPNRFNDGYGLSMPCIREHASNMQRGAGLGLMISVDCGIRSVQEVADSRELGLEWVITDHHTLGPECPDACAVVHPRLGENPNPHLAGVGVAFKLAQALLDAAPVPRGTDRAFLDGLLKLVAIGSIADVVPLVGENAALVKRGLQALGTANGPGLVELFRIGKIEGVPGAQALAFNVCPRLNAVGRMGGAEDAVRLLLCRDPEEAKALAERVEQLNAERRTIQQDLLNQLAEPDGAAFDLVVEPSANKGVIGIVAGRRMQEHGRPVAVCTQIDGVVQCSLRAPEGYDLGVLLEAARPFLITGGGHRTAAGMSFLPARTSFVRETLIRGAQQQAQGIERPAFLLDGERPEDVPDAGTLARLEPFGQGFPPPQIRLSGSLASAPAPFGKGHCRLKLTGCAAELTWFTADPSIAALPAGADLDVVIAPQDHPRWGRSWIVDGRISPGGQA